jgi:CHAT domain-containing protein/tetratricopeptide (TPR) repeat protein
VIVQCRRWLILAAAVTVLGTLFSPANLIAPRALAQNNDELATLRAEVRRLLGAGRYRESIAAAERYVETARRLVGEQHPSFGAATGWLASSHMFAGNFGEAERLHRQVLALYEKILAPDDARLGTVLNNLGDVYRLQGRSAEAEPLLRRSLAIAEKTWPEAGSVALSLINLGHALMGQGKLEEAEAIYLRSLAIRQKEGDPDNLEVARTIKALGNLYSAQQRYAEAEDALKRALAIRRKKLGPNHPEVSEVLNDLGALYDSPGRHKQAAQVIEDAVTIAEKRFGPDHPQVSIMSNNLAMAYFSERKWGKAADVWRRSTNILKHRDQLGIEQLANVLEGKSRTEAVRYTHQFQGLVRAAYRASAGKRDEDAVMREMFETAQWARASDLAATLAQMATRSAKGDGQLSKTIRERQDLVVQWQESDAARIMALSRPPEERDRQSEARNTARLNEIEARLADIEKTLVDKFPDYAAMAKPAPASITNVQDALHANEALVLFLDLPDWDPAPEEAFIWVVTKSLALWARSTLGTAALRQEVTALRCGLDASQWLDEGAGKCSNLLRLRATKAPKDNEPLPFDLKRAHRLYKALFGAFEDEIRDKHLLVVPSGSLTQLPLQVLVTTPVSSTDYRAVGWLGKLHPITVLPSVSSLKALRQIAKSSKAQKPILGVGNPLLDGDPASRPWDAEWARLARDRQSCAALPSIQTSGTSTVVQSGRAVLRPAGAAGGASIAQLRMQSPLYDTADELCAVAGRLKADPADVMLGARATEHNLKRLSDSGELATYRILHFATHGAMAGEVTGSSEAGLILTPPREGSEDDDGYLSASEVAAMKLDAEWVILSACNTAAGSSQDAEALSGLARGFLYAGARALLVSHWSVDSAATVKLITLTLEEMDRDRSVGRAEALKLAMGSMIDEGGPTSHPAFWSPFIIVGEGSVR